MSKRSQPDSQRNDLPPPKKPRYNYDVRTQLLQQPRTLHRMSTHSDDDTLSDTERTTSNRPTLTSTTRPIKVRSNISKRRIPNQANNKSPDDWCPIRWLRNRVYHQDAVDFFDILPHDEADGVAKELLMHVGASTTLISNIMSNLDTMNAITKYIQNQHENAKHKDQNLYHSSKKSRRLTNKQKKRWIREQNEVLNTCDSPSLHSMKEKYISSIQKNVERYHNNDNKYILYETERKAIWKSIPNGTAPHTITPTPPPTNSNYDSFLSGMHQTTNISQKIGAYVRDEDSEFMTSEHESDEDFSLYTDDGSDCYSSKRRKKSKRKKRKKRKKKQRKRKIIQEERESELESLYVDGKNPVYIDTQPQRFWAKFRGYFEPADPEELRSLIPELQGDAYPVKIASLPNEKSFITKSYNFDGDDELSFADIHEMNDEEDLKENHNDSELYFAEMPKNYEYFTEDSCLIDEQHHIESIHNTQALKQNAIYQQYPHKSLMGHSFDQRSLSCFVHECQGMYNIEHEVDENDWRKIGKKKSKNYKEEEMIEPVIKYEPVHALKTEKGITFEASLRQQIGKYFFNNNAQEIQKIVATPWFKRLDDECCATIKSLEGTLEHACFEKAPNDIEINMKIAMEIMQIVQNEDPRNYHSYQQLINHVAQIEKNHIDSNGEFVVDHQTLTEPAWRQYFKEKESLRADKAVEAYMPSLHVQTTQK